MVIQHNLSAVNSYGNVCANNAKTASASEKLASGYRINRAADDAGGTCCFRKNAFHDTRS